MNAFASGDAGLFDAVQVQGHHAVRVDRSRDALLTDFGRATLNDPSSSTAAPSAACSIGEKIRAGRQNQRRDPVHPGDGQMDGLTPARNHVAAYSRLLDTVGHAESEYTAFMKYKEMKDKYDYMQSFRVDSKHEIAKPLAAFGAFTEGLQLFAAFAILLNFPRFNKMKGMGQIISWSVRDETLHCLSIIRLFRPFVHENPEIWTETLRQEIYAVCATIVEHEDAFIDLAFEQGPIEVLRASEVKSSIRYIADRRLMQLGLNPIFHIEDNPLTWLDEMLNAVEHANFVENRSTEYSRASTQGSWEEAFADAVFESNQPQGAIELL